MCNKVLCCSDQTGEEGGWAVEAERQPGDPQQGPGAGAHQEGEAASG